jgi:hypothetical protein
MPPAKKSAPAIKKAPPAKEALPAKKAAPPKKAAAPAKKAAAPVKAAPQVTVTLKQFAAQLAGRTVGRRNRRRLRMMSAPLRTTPISRAWRAPTRCWRL